MSKAELLKRLQEHTLHYDQQEEAATLLRKQDEAIRVALEALEDGVDMTGGKRTRDAIKLLREVQG